MDDLTTNILLGSILSGLIFLFTYKSMRTKLQVPYFITSFIFNAAGAIYYITMVIFIPNLPEKYLIPLELMLFGFSQFFMYLFLESLINLSHKYIFFTFEVMALTMQQLSLIFIMLLPDGPASTSIMWFFADLAYNVLGLITNALTGLPIYVKNYYRSRKKTALILIIAFGLSAFGFLFLFIGDIFWYFAIFRPVRTMLSEIGNLLSTLGYISTIAVYIVDIHHFLQVPSDLFVLMISDHDNNVIFQSRYRSLMKPKSIVSEGVPELIGSVSRIFKGKDPKRTSIQIEIDKDISLLREFGDEYISTIITDNGSRMLSYALRRFMTEFEDKLAHEEKARKFGKKTGKFEKNNERMTPFEGDQRNLSDFIAQVVDLATRNFPFLMNTGQCRLLDQPLDS